MKTKKKKKKGIMSAAVAARTDPHNYLENKVQVLVVGWGLGQAYSYMTTRPIFPSHGFMDDHKYNYYGFTKIGYRVS